MRDGAGVPAAVFFDLDDTIFDHALTCRDALGALRRERSLFQRRSLDELATEYSRLLEAVHPEVLAGRWDADDARRVRFERLAAFCGSTLSRAGATDLSQQYRRHYQSRGRLVPGARRLLEQLHGRTIIGIVTNNESAEQREKLAYLGVTHLVDHLVVSEEVGVGKPDPRIFETALGRAGVSAKETVMVGDSWANDVVGAREAGIGAVWFNRFAADPPEALAVPEIRSFRSPRSTEAVLFREASRPRGRSA